MNNTNIVNIPHNIRWYWSAKYGECLLNGSISEFLKRINPNITFIFTSTDGIVSNRIYTEVVQETPYLFLNEQCLSNLESTAIPKTVPVICTLATRDVYKKNILLLPTDDYTFKHGLASIFKDIDMIPWENRLKKVFWRGNPSGYERPTTRERVITKLYDNSYSDCKFAFNGNLGGYANTISEKYKVQERTSLQGFLNYKYLLVIDGITIGGNMQWVFGSGSVPIIVTHPKHNWWFKKFLVPMKHYVPIEYDLSDLEEKLEWLVNNDNNAHEIAKNALNFSEEVISSDFQKRYIINTINENLRCIV